MKNPEFRVRIYPPITTGATLSETQPMTRITRTLFATAALMFATAQLASGQATGQSPHPVMQAYYHVKNALVAGDSAHAKTDAATLLTALARIDTAALSATDKAALARVTENATHMSRTTDLAHQRHHFIPLSKDMITVARDAKLGKSYVLFCPMANDGKGAYWLSDTTKIANPYWSGAMKTCGSVKDTLR